MFSRRRPSSAHSSRSRSSATVAATAPSSAAATAASQAFIQRSTQNAALSSAAAAAALRTHATTPEPVGSIVTKRMVRRGSTSSTGSARPTGTPIRAGLQRSNSSGSMTERTFRAASPSPSRGNGTTSPATDPPPMPLLPKAIRSDARRRPGSTEPPARVFSPVPPRNARSASVDIPTASKMGTSRHVNRLSHVPETTARGGAAQGNRASVNFSRPRMSSPEPGPVTPTPGNRNIHSAGGWFTGPVGSASAGLGDEKKPSALQFASQFEGSADDVEEVMVYDANTRTFVRSIRPKPKVEPPSPVADRTPALKPGDYDPATRRIVPSTAAPKNTSAESTPSLSASPTASRPSSRAGADADLSSRSPVKQTYDRTTSTRPTALHKQPSIVREDPDAERAAEEGFSPTTASATSSEPLTADTSIQDGKAGAQHKRVLSLDVPHTAGDRGRGGSLSPSRNARFSAAPVLQNVMHEPPQRGISPVKSALKRSPSSSVRTASPITTFSPTPAAQGATSDMSDTTSLTSAEGSTIGGKKRKSARVSWDDAAAVPPLPDSTKTVNATSVKAVRSQDLTSDDDDAEEYLQPRPILPSFGSVRGDRRHKDEDHAVESTIPPSENQPTPQADAQGAGEPLPPEVTSKEAAEPNLETGNSEEDMPVAAVTGATTTATDQNANPSTKEVLKEMEKSDENVPAINLLPPTPGVDETGRELGTDDETTGMTDSQELRSLAAGIVRYGDESDSSSRKKTTPIPQYVRKDSDGDVYSDAPESQDGAQQGFASLDAIVESPVASPQRTTAPDSTLTALADSPDAAVVTNNTAAAAAPTTTSTEQPVDWSAASAHWSQQKAQAQQAQLSSGDEKKSKRSFFRRNKHKKEDKQSVTPIVTSVDTTATTAPPQEAESSVATATTSTPKASPQPLKSALKNSTVANRGVVDDGFHLPKTMRGDSAKLGNNAQAPKTNGVRPASVDHGSAVRQQITAPKPGRLSHSGPYPGQTTTSSKLLRRVKDDSDSDSSFKKKRQPLSSQNAPGRYTMRRSMRTGSIDSSKRMASPPPNAGRSMSPMSDSSRTTSLRQSLRSGGPPARASRGSNMNTPSKAPKPAPLLTSRLKSRFVDSDDSDEDAAIQPRPVYRSRFVDSDEDDTIAEELPPVRGIPKRKGQEDGDSTDLEDESDVPGSPSKRRSHAANAISNDPAEVEKIMELARKKLGISDRSASDRGQNFVKGTVRTNGRNRDEDKVLVANDVMSDAGSEATTSKKKRGFIRSLLGRSRGNSQSTIRSESPPPPVPPVSLMPNQTQQKGQTETPESPSAAKLVRRTSHPSLKRGNSNLSATTAPTAPISKSSDKDSEHWPLVPPVPQDKSDTLANRDTERPQTSDDGMHSSRLSERPQNRRSFSARVGFTDEAIAHSERDESVLGTEPGVVYSQRTGRKKKFSMLRRAFGLYD